MPRETLLAKEKFISGCSMNFNTENNLFRFLYGTLQIIRPVNFIIAFASIIVAGLICIDGQFLITNIFFAAFSGALVGAAGNIINDYFDLEIDKINRPTRMLPSGILTPFYTVFLYLLCTIIAFFLSLFIGVEAFTVVLISSVTIFLYSFRLKKVVLLGNFVVAFFTGFAFIYGGIAVNNWQFGIIPAVFAFMTNLIRELVKDIEDIKGDSANNVITFPQKFGTGKTILLINILTAILIIFTTIPFFLKIYRIEYFVIVMVLVNSLFVYLMHSLYKNQSAENLRRVSNLLKLNMVFGLIAIFLGK
ncbi:geranylgeranylglycerol-phosphate geranylgeranyltransferase [Patescibacteria group bacterium]|nr:geranylgeranylglycerol-phosphate geranylgeranyltransferase [Patescibacteria group bacterium]